MSRRRFEADGSFSKSNKIMAEGRRPAFNLLQAVARVPSRSSVRPEAIPVILLAQLAVDRRFQGRGFARQLLFYALKTCFALSKNIGCFGVITHPLDEELRAFYHRFGFVDLPGDPHRAMIVRMTDLEQSGFEA
ncbi:MAG: GNAT family N-acetyltransferase [Alphaproteobacteria bacterium]|nr:GNAT family N-acetyltransferase [Alphaproteobacteria bacterium]